MIQCRHSLPDVYISGGRLEDKRKTKKESTEGCKDRNKLYKLKAITELVGPMESYRQRVLL